MGFVANRGAIRGNCPPFEPSLSKRLSLRVICGAPAGSVSPAKRHERQVLGFSLQGGSEKGDRFRSGPCLREAGAKFQTPFKVPEPGAFPCAFCRILPAKDL